jgi:hypothetical protein
MDNGQSTYDFFVNQGLAPHQAAGVVGNLQGESGQGLNPNAINPGDGRDGSDSIGIGQWNGDRAQALKDYAASKNAPWNDLNTQLEFLHGELKGPEKAAYQGLLAAKTPEAAGQAMLAYERPKDWNKPGAHPERAQYAARAMQAYGGGAQPGAPVAGTQPSAQPGAPGTPSAPPAPPVAPQQQPIFASAAPVAPAPVPTYHDPAPPIAPIAPLFAAQRKPIDISGLRAALAARSPIFANQG